MLTKSVLVCCLLVASWGGSGVARAQVNTLPLALDNLAIEDKSGAALPLDAVLTDHNGQPVTLGAYFDGKTPTVIVMAYYSCPMLCTLVLNGLTKAIKEIEFGLGRDFRVVVVSIDPRDTRELAAQKRSNYVLAYGRPVASGRSLDFLRGNEAEVRRIADSLGFKYRWDEEGKQYAHAAAAFVATPAGVLSRTLYGIVFQPRDVRLALVEASRGKLGSSIDKLTLFCFHYDPQKRGYVLAAKRVMQLGGLATMLILGTWLSLLWRRHSGQQAPPTAPSVRTEQSA